jgi:hypothetical protein
MTQRLAIRLAIRGALSSLDECCFGCVPLLFSELFYNDKSLFQCQPYSNSMLDLLASLLQLRRDELHTDASAKGFIMGELQYELEDFAEPSPNEGGGQIAAASAAALLALPPALTLVNCETPQVITPFPQQIRGQSKLNSHARDAKTSSRACPRLPDLGNVRRCSFAFATGMACSASWMLIVEKDTVFRKLVATAFPLLHNCILVTVSAHSPA